MNGEIHNKMLKNNALCKTPGKKHHCFTAVGGAVRQQEAEGVSTLICAPSWKFVASLQITVNSQQS